MGQNIYIVTYNVADDIAGYVADVKYVNKAVPADAPAPAYGVPVAPVLPAAAPLLPAPVRPFRPAVVAPIGVPLA